MRMHKVRLPPLYYFGKFVEGSDIAMWQQRTNQVRNDKHIDSGSASLFRHETLVTDRNTNLGGPSEGSNEIENVNRRTARDGSRNDV
jgi:hypothetical protein